MRIAPLQKGKRYVGSVVALRESSLRPEADHGVGLAILTAKRGLRDGTGWTARDTRFRSFWQRWRGSDPAAQSGRVRPAQEMGEMNDTEVVKYLEAFLGGRLPDWSEQSQQATLATLVTCMDGRLNP